jgi:hypothetical protein
VPELGLYYYKARFYDPRLPRFLQPDPIGYAAGMNRYAYVGGDPVNRADPLGLKDGDVVVTGIRCKEGYHLDRRFDVCVSDTLWVVQNSVLENKGEFGYSLVPLLGGGAVLSGNQLKDAIKQAGGRLPNQCPPVSALPRSFGFGAGAHGFLGTPVASLAGSASRMFFLGGGSATTFSGGGAIAALDQYGGYPTGPRSWVLGGALGLDTFGTISNATSQYQLQGPFHTVDVAASFMDVQISWSGEIWQVSAGPGSLGLGIASYETTTAVQSGGCHP